MSPHDDDKIQDGPGDATSAGREEISDPADARTPHPKSVIDRLKGYASRLGKAPAEPLQVLVVDDEPSVRRFVDRVLRDAGYVTATAGDGTEAIEVASGMPKMDLLVTDLMMPKMTGDELARRLRQSQPSLKVLYLTGYADRLFREKVTLWEGEAFLDKPCSVQGLQEAVSLLAFGRFVAPTRPA